jgi:RimJ/RimL family protein N-acetyltransferase
MVGLFGLDRPDRTPRFGYWVIREFRGRGLAVAAARALGGWAHAELGIETLLLDIEPANEASHRVAAKLGGERVGEVMQGTVRLVRYELAAGRLRRT